MKMTADMFELADETALGEDWLADGAVVLRGFVGADSALLVAAMREISARAPFRHMVTPGGFRMSVAMTNCGELGWTSDASGYRYAVLDPETGRAWPTMPASFMRLAQGAALQAGFPGFVPDACLVNRYESGAKLSLHQDKDEHDFTQPIVSVSLGIPALFLFGGEKRAELPRRILLTHGDVVVWGGPSRRRYHGVLPIRPGQHPLVGAFRINLTFRKAG